MLFGHRSRSALDQSAETSNGCETCLSGYDTRDVSPDGVRTVGRSYAHRIVTEAETLLEFLDRQRAAVFTKLSGLSDVALRSAVFPSGWTCLGLVQHLALDDERYWFRWIAAGETVELQQGDIDGAEWVVGPDWTAQNVFDLYRAEIRRANAVVATIGLDAPPMRTDPRWPDWKIPNLRWIILHMIEETARHVGHLDTARELLDGRTGLV